MRVVHGIAAAVSMAACSAWAQVTYEWTDITPPDSVIVSAGVHPIDGRVIVAGYTATPFTPLVRYSNDRGRTWNAPLAQPPYATSLFVHPGRPGVVYLEVAGFLGSVRFGTTSTKGSVYRSDDFGRTWALAYTGRDGESIQVFGADPFDAHGAYALRKPGQKCGAFLGCIFEGNFEIARTSDDGVQWTTVSVLPNSSGGYTSPQGPAPANPTRLFLTLSSNTVLVSNDRGATWSPFPFSLAPRLESLVPDPLRANVLYARRYSADEEFFNNNLTLRSDDGGASWRETFRSFTSRSVFVDPSRSRTVWLSPQPDGLLTFALHRSEDSGETWQALPLPLGLSFLQGFYPSAAEPGTVYALSNNRIWRGVPSKRPDPIVVEFHYDIDRYWITSLDGEAVSQDYRKEPGNVWRTGLRWGAWNAGDAPAGAVGSCRFWPKPETGWRTRVMVLKDGECESLRSDPKWILEGEDEFFAVPSRDHQTCPAGLVPVRRFHNLQPDFNHRWVADPSLFAEMRVQRAWYDEGVRFCSRPLGPNE